MKKIKQKRKGLQHLNKTKKKGLTVLCSVGEAIARPEAKAATWKGLL